LCLTSLAHAQWSDVKRLGNGGESTVATDGKGNVYVTAHQSCQINVSHDYGASFQTHYFNDGFCDMDVIAWPNGNVNVSFIKPNVSGLASYYSKDLGRTFVRGSALDGPLDREWLAPNLVNGDLYMDYSHGYIGGPTSTGVYFAVSHNGGKTFDKMGRVDKSAPADHAVDPYLVTSTDGRIYAMWSTTSDDDTIDRFDFAYSTDGGKSFKGHTTIGAVHKKLGDTQERWMLGALTSFGKKDVLALYSDYKQVDVDGKSYKPLLTFYRLSRDGGESWSEPQTVSPADEIEESIRKFEAKKIANVNVPQYMQTLPWACADDYGRFYAVYEDNRSGQGTSGDVTMDKWGVRTSTMELGSDSFSTSEAVSKPYIAKRPPLDFISCAADKRRFYVSWTESPGYTGDMDFTGELWFGRKIIHAP